MNAKDLLIQALKNMGADGLVYPEIECGCGFDDFEPCDGCCLSHCIPAKKKDEMYYPMEENI